jgi:hypothetical protein
MFYPTLVADLSSYEHRYQLPLRALFEYLVTLRNFWTPKNKQYATGTKLLMNAIIGVFNSKYSVLNDHRFKFHILGNGRKELERFAAYLKEHCILCYGTEKKSICEQQIFVMNYQTDSILVGFPFFKSKTKEEFLKAIKYTVTNYLTLRNATAYSSLKFQIRVQYSIDYVLIFNVNKFILLLDDGSVKQSAMAANTKANQSDAMLKISSEFWKEFILFASSKSVDVANFRSKTLQKYSATNDKECELILAEYNSRINGPILQLVQNSSSANLRTSTVKIPQDKISYKRTASILLVDANEKHHFQELKKIYRVCEK